MKLSKLLALVLFLNVGLALQAEAQSFNYTQPAFNATARLKYDDMALELSGINTDKTDFVDLDTCAEIAAIIAGETGSCGSLVLSTSPTLVTPILGVAAATSINKVAITAPATSATLTIADGATLTASATATVSGTNTGDDDVPDAADFGALALTGDVTSSGLATTIAANSVALTTDTTGNYAAGDAEAGASLSGDSATAYFSAGTIEDARIAGSAEVDEVLNSDLGDFTCTAGSCAIDANAIALTTDTTGNYMADIAAGAGIAVTHTPAEGSTGTIAFSYADAGASPSLGADACQFTSNATTSGFIVCEGDTADAFETRIFVTDPSADRLVTVPNADSATVQPLTCGGSDKVSAISALGVVTCTADAGAGGGISNVVEDLTPQLGGALDTNGQNIEFGTAATDTSVVRSSAGNLSIEGNVVYRAGGTDVPLADGGTGASLVDPNADRVLFWDDSAGAFDFLTMGSAYTFSTTTLRSPTESICVKMSDETTAITTGADKVKIIVPYAFTVTSVIGFVSTVSSSGTPTFDINEDPDAEAGGSASTTILGTKIVIDVSERRSTTGGTPTITDASLAAFSELSFDIDTAGTGAKGAEACLIGYQT